MKTTITPPANPPVLKQVKSLEEARLGVLYKSDYGTIGHVARDTESHLGRRFIPVEMPELWTMPSFPLTELPSGTTVTLTQD